MTHVVSAGPRLTAALSVVALALSLLVAVAPTASGQADVTPARIDGETRYHTAANIATFTFDQADIAHVVTGQDFPDALAGSFAAGSTGGPLLLVTSDAVPRPTWEALEELDVQTVVLIGGFGVISESVEQQLAEAGYATERISGANRYHTAAAVASHYGQERVGTVAGQRAAILATGVHFADALAAGPIAARERLPLFLTPHDRTEPMANNALDELGIERIFLLGGPLAISEEVEQAYRDRGYDVERVGGPTRMDTAWLLADQAVHDFGFTHELVLLARGEAYPDALAASIHGATTGAPLVLTASSTELSQPTRDWLTRTCPDIRAIRALGGTSVVTQNVLNDAVQAAEACRDAGEDALAAVTDDGRVVVLDANTGEEIRELMTGVRTDDPAKNDIAVSPGQTHAYVALPAEEPSGEERLVRVPFAGGQPQLVAAGGSAPAVSPDGSTLAYVVYEQEDLGHPDPVLVLRNLVSGDEVRFAADERNLIFISDVEWTADGEEIIFTAGEIHTSVYAVKRTATRMAQARRLGPEGRAHGHSWRETAAFGDGLAVTEQCCDFPYDEQWNVIAVDPADGSVEGRLVPAERVEAVHLDSTADARGLLLVVRGGSDGNQLLRWTGSGPPETVTTSGVMVAAW